MAGGSSSSRDRRVQPSLLGHPGGQALQVQRRRGGVEQLTSLYPAPAFIRSNNGPEFIAHVFKRRSENSGTTTAYIKPGSPWQNGFAESFNSRFRDEFLNTELLSTVAEAQALATVAVGVK